MSHMPPELLRSGRMSTAVDIYSLGIMMWEMYSREVAFKELHYGEASRLVHAQVTVYFGTNLFTHHCKAARLTLPLRCCTLLPNYTNSSFFVDFSICCIPVSVG
eukprot:GHUV01019865.1.p1 GENE.GHUV01019865.1~~GHUV01019865.1.p1  ORF type:complete len:104 (+),score=19.50 GHUV01019865.1:160-471(+)